MLINIENKLIVKIFEILTVHIEEKEEIKVVITLINGSIFTFACENKDDAEKSLLDIWNAIQLEKKEWPRLLGS
jgi:hypothetical protein